MYDYSVIFDMDGVIFDSEKACLYCWTEIAERYSLPSIKEVFYKCIGTNKVQSEMIVEEAYSGQYGDGIAKKLLTESSLLFHELYDNGNLDLKPGVVDILEHLKHKGIKMAVASSTRKAVVETEFRDAKLLHYFDKIIGGDAVTISKPNPEIYLIACKTLEVDPNKTFAIEDSFNGIRAAYAAGMRPIMVPDMVPPDEEMKQISEVICKDLFEVKSFLDKI